MNRYLLLIIASFILSGAEAQKKPSAEATKKNLFETSVFEGLSFRFIGPGSASGRIADFAVNPRNPKEYFVAVASGGVWKTVNAGITYDPVFDNENRRK